MNANPPILGTIYLLHFDPPYLHAGHYLGWSENHEARVAQHLRGEGSPLVRAALALGSIIEVARLWHGVDRHLERRLKNHGKARICPVCTPQTTRPKGCNG